MSLLEIEAGSLGVPAPTIVSTKAGNIQLVDTGEGNAFISLHGGLGGYDQSWLLARALLADIGAWRVLALSRPGYLDTTLGLGRTPEEQADAYAMLLDTLKIERAVVAAVSAGGASALHFAARHPDRCRALILASAVSGTLGVPPVALCRLRMVTWLAKTPPTRAWLRRKVLNDPKETARWSISDPAVVARTFADPQAGPLFRAFQETVAYRLNDRLPGMISDVGVIRKLPRPPFERVRAPLLAIHGDVDPVVPLGHAERAASEVAGARLCAIPGGEHAVLFTHPLEIRAAASAFLATI